MNGSERTKEDLANSIKEIMAIKSLDKITVKEIVDNCGMTRQTFYRYFHDKYDLVNWYFDKLAQQTIRKMGVSLTLQEGLIKKFKLLKKEKGFFTEAFKSRDCNSLFDYDLQLITEYYTNLISSKKNEQLDTELQFLLDMYCLGSMHMMLKWILDGMKIEPEEIVSFLINGMPEKLKPYLVFRNSDTFC
ncbi:MAG: TetR/AcrR family transcriptional regulator C-terminal domain-containing protein [Bacteroidales bacterium]